MNNHSNNNFQKKYILLFFIILLLIMERTWSDKVSLNRVDMFSSFYIYFLIALAYLTFDSEVPSSKKIFLYLFLYLFVIIFAFIYSLLLFLFLFLLLLIILAYMAYSSEESIQKNIYLYLFLCLLFITFYQDFVYNFYTDLSWRKNPSIARMKWCRSNMRFIEESVELYLQEHNNKNKIISLEELVSKGYLKAIPSCRGTMFRYISFLSISAYKVPSKKQYEIIYDKDKHFVDIKCDVHGFLHADEGKYVGVPYYFRNRL